MTRSWLCCVTVALGVVAWAVAGCGSGESFHNETRYTPESLASELVFRYKRLDPARRNDSQPKPRTTALVKASPKSVAEANRDARATTLDDLVRETLGKINLIEGMSRTEAVTRMAEAVGKDASVAEADRKTITERLQAEGGAKSAPID